jgi:hypothetical protein
MASAVAALSLLMLTGCSLAGRTVGTFVDDKALIAPSSSGWPASIRVTSSA